MATTHQELTRFFDKQAELDTLKQLLKITEQMLRSGTYTLDLATGRMDFSDGMFGLMGYEKPDPEEDINREFYLCHVSPKDRPGFEKALEEAVRNNSSFEYTYTLIQKSRNELIVFTQGNIIADEDGMPVKLTGVTKDITTVHEYEQSLQEKVKELDRSNKELEEFAYIASHDLQEPLRKITSFSERLKEKLGDALSPESQMYLTRMLAATDNMRALIDNLLQFSRTSRYSQPFQHADLKDILVEVVADLELQIEESNAMIYIESLPQLEVIPSQIRQLFTNLLTNAIKFRNPDQRPEIFITSKIITREEKEHYHYRNSRPCYLLSVKDNGIGFEQEFASRIFQIFQRLHGKAEYPGTGIGLAICKKITENHKGTIFAKGTPGIGSEFTIIIPEHQN